MRSSRDMAPVKEKFRNDATFNALLSSQRELLNKLKLEKQLAQTEMMRKNGNNEDLGVNGSNWEYAATNQSIGLETFRTDNMLLSRRLSLGIGSDCFILPDDAQFDSDQYAESFSDAADGAVKKQPTKEGKDTPNGKRRRTTLSFLDYIFDKHEESKQAYPIKKPEKQRFEYYDHSDDSDDDDYGVFVQDISDDDVDSNDETENEVRPIMNLKEAKEKMASFDAAMSKTQKSQQSIHDWDRKMGLKRSHSKTMRLSSRSRKQLREIMEKDIEGLSNQ